MVTVPEALANARCEAAYLARSRSRLLTPCEVLDECGMCNPVLEVSNKMLPGGTVNGTVISATLTPWGC